MEAFANSEVNGSKTLVAKMRDRDSPVVPKLYSARKFSGEDGIDDDDDGVVGFCTR